MTRDARVVADCILYEEHREHSPTMQPLRVHSLTEVWTTSEESHLGEDAAGGDPGETINRSIMGAHKELAF